MRILFVNEYAPPHFVSGGEYSMVELAKALRESQVETLILSPHLGGQSDGLKFQVALCKSSQGF